MKTTNFGTEVVIASTEQTYSDAKTAAANIGFNDLRIVARLAGLDGWVSREDTTTGLTTVGRDVTDALNMPFPSPNTREIRESAGYPEGISTDPSANTWSLAVAPSLDPDQPYDIGVQLVNIKPDSHVGGCDFHLPLDITVANPSIVGSRPDRLIMQIGERQLPGTNFFIRESAQRLVMVASKFMWLLGSGEADEQLALHEASRLQNKPALSKRRSLKRLLLGEG